MLATEDYLLRVYAGVLGKIIGVYLGRPIEGWSYEKITERFGVADDYLHDSLGVPLVVTDDDISGTFTFLRALPDSHYDPRLTPGQIGDAWLNHIIEDRTILWWGGLGVSTEHTAYLRLKHGMKAPASGSIRTNGKTCAEQIGSQIFIDGWGMICPGEPDRAADYARRAASVSHDGEAIYGAQVVAALVAQAFVEKDVGRLIGTAASLIPEESTISRLIADVRSWHTAHPGDWRATRARVAEKYGYDRYGGGCHIVPNHALVILALLHGAGDFDESLAIVNTCGWDTDCNAANVGCILGVSGGLAAFEGRRAWRGPVADRMFICASDGGRCITDALREAVTIVNTGHALQALPPVRPKDGARFHFSLPGSVQGFTVTSGDAALSNRDGALRIATLNDAPVTVTTATFIGPAEWNMPGYELLASPTLYPGQVVTARLSASAPAQVALIVSHYGPGDALTVVHGPRTSLGAAETAELRWAVPPTNGQPIANVGLQIRSAAAGGTVLLDSLGWGGPPDCPLGRPPEGDRWLCAWVSSLSDVTPWGGGFRVVKNENLGLLTQGTREWADYALRATLRPCLADEVGVCARVQGLRRYYALVLTGRTHLQLRKMFDDTTLVLASADMRWELDTSYEFSLIVTGGSLSASLDGHRIFDVLDEHPLETGYIGILLNNGAALVEGVGVSPTGSRSAT